MSNTLNWKNMLKSLIIVTFICCSLILFIKKFFTIDNKKYTYNMNVSESINLDKVYKNDKFTKGNNVTWNTNDKNIIIENSIVTAKNPGKAKITATDKNNNKIKEILINVLKKKDMSIDSHNIKLKLKQSKKIVVNNKKLSKSVVIENQNKESELDNNKIIEHLSKIYPSFEISEKELFSNIKSVIVKEEINEEDLGYKYESSDESVAVVDNEGNIETVSSGDTIITVTDSNGNEDYVHVVVDDDDIDLYTTEYNLNIDEYVQVEYNLNSIFFKEKDIKWSSDNPSIAKVNESGLITAINSGSTYITVNVGNVIQKKIKVNVLQNLTLPEELDISSEKVNLKIREYQVVSANVYPYSSVNKEVIWKSDNESIATVNNGVIRAVGYGETIVSATTINGVRREIKVVVDSLAKEVEEVKFSTHSIDMNINEEKKINYDIIPNDAIDKSIKFYYDNNYIKVDEKGNIKALKEGSTILTITTSNGKIDTMIINIKSNETFLSKYIELNKNTIDLNIGDTDKLNATLKNENEEEELVWNSSNNKIVNVDQEGNIRAITSGSAIISVYLKSNNNVRANCYVIVKPKEVIPSKIKLNNNKIQLTVGDSKVLIPTIEPSNTTNKEVKWISSNEKVVTVDNNGSIKAIGAGNATVKVMMVKDHNITDSCEVSVETKEIGVSKLVLNKSSLKLTIGDTNKLTPVISPSNATDKNVKWISSNEKIVTVDNNGNIKAVGTGSTTIKVMMNNNTNIYSSCNIIVNPKIIAVKKIKISKNKLNLIVGEKHRLLATAYPNNATNKKIVWKSSNDKIATVSQLGLIKALKPGKVTIVATSKTNNNVKIKSIVTIKEINGSQKILNYAEKKYNKIESDGDWTWGKGHHKTTCCNFVDEVLIKTGYLREKWLCHTGKTSKPTGLNLLYKDKVKVYYNKSIKKLNPGDVVVWSKSGSKDGNIAIFAYKKDKKYYFYGASYSKEVKDKHHPSSRMSDYWKEKSGKLTIIRASE